TRYFVNSLGIGFDAEIVRVAENSIFKPLLNKIHLGSLIYVLALVKTLFKFTPSTITVELDGRTHTFTQCWMITIANHPFYGGGMKILPSAKIQPENISILVIHGISKWKILALFMTVFTGKHTTFSEVEVFKAKEVKIIPMKQMSYQVDGQKGICDLMYISKDEFPMPIIGSYKTIAPACKIS